MADDVTHGDGAAQWEPRLPQPPAAEAHSPLPPPPSGPQPAPPPATPSRKPQIARKGFLIAGGIIVVVGVVSRIVGGEDDGDSTTRNASGEITKAGDVAVEWLRVGDCLEFDEGVVATMTADPEGSDVTTVHAVPCAQEHNGEVIHRDKEFFDLANGFPDGAASMQTATPACLARLEVYAGVPVDAGVLDVGTMTPSEDGWPADRSLVCIGTTLNDELTDVIRTTGSLRAPSSETPLPLPTFKPFSDSVTGECYDVRAALERTPDLIPALGRLVPCAETHTFEVVSNDSAYYEGAAGPPRLDDSEPDDMCVAALVEYTGESYETSPYDYFALLPTEESWEFSDRALTCLGATFDASGLIHPTGSIAAT